MVNKDKVSGGEIRIRFSGGEYTQIRWTTTSGSDKNAVTHHHRVHSSCVIFNNDVSLYNNSQDHFAKGQYEFPFSFTLPQGIPPSMCCSLGGDHGGYGKVCYTVGARLHRSSWTSWDVHTTSEVTVINPPVVRLPSCVAYVAPQRQAVTGCCCLPRGGITIGLFTKQSLLAAGEAIQVNFIAENSSNATIKAIEVTVQETVSWQAGGKNRKAEHILCKRRCTVAEVPALHLPILKKKQQQQGGNSNSAVIDEMSVLRSFRDALQAGETSVSCILSTTAFATMTGRLMTVQHRLFLKVCTTFGNSNPMIWYPLTVHRCGSSLFDLAAATPNTSAVAVATYPEQQTQPLQPALPADWHAMVATPVTVSELSVTASPLLLDNHDSHEAIEQILMTAPPPGHNNPMQTMNAQILHGISSLLTFLNTSSLNQQEIFAQWILVNSVEIITPNDFYAILLAIKNNFTKMQIVESFTELRPFISCGHILAASDACPEELKIEVITKLASKCFEEKEELKKQLQGKLTPFQFICVEQSLV